MKHNQIWQTRGCRCWKAAIKLLHCPRAKNGKNTNVWSLRSKLVLCGVKFNLRYFFVLKRGNEQKEIDNFNYNYCFKKHERWALIMQLAGESYEYAGAINLSFPLVLLPQWHDKWSRRWASMYCLEKQKHKRTAPSSDKWVCSFPLSRHMTSKLFLWRAIPEFIFFLGI